MVSTTTTSRSVTLRSHFGFKQLVVPSSLHSKMVKAVLAPKSIEDQFIRRVWQGHDKGLVNKVLTPVGTDILRVCLCMDGRSGASNHNSVYAGLKQLFEWWGEHVQIEINLFTFLCAAGSLQEAELLQLLTKQTYSTSVAFRR